MEGQKKIVQLLKENRLEKARKTIYEVYEKNPKLYNYYTALCCCKEKNYEEAIGFFKRAEKEGLRYYLLYYNLGVAYMEANDYQNSELCFLKSIEKQKYFSKIYINLAYIKIKQGDLKSAYRIIKLGLSYCNDNELQNIEERLFKSIQYI